MIVRRPVAVPKNIKPILAPTAPKNQLALLSQAEALQAVKDENKELEDALDDELLKGVDPADELDLRRALDALEKDGNEALLDKLVADGKVPAATAGARKAAADLGRVLAGGTTPQGAAAWINRVQNQINNMNAGNPAVAALQAQLNAVQAANMVQVIIAAIAAGNPIGPIVAGFGPLPPIVGLPIMVDVIPVVDLSAWSPMPSGVLLLNPEENAAAVSYVINKRNAFTMLPAQSQKLLARAENIIEFDRGAGSGKARYRLHAGSYEFTVTERGWELVRRREYEVTIDNTAYAGEFGYVVNGRQAQVRPGEMMTHRSPYPIQITFDRADDGAPAHKRLRSGVYQVGIDAGQGRLDLFPKVEAPQLASAPQPKAVAPLAGSFQIPAVVAPLIGN